MQAKAKTLSLFSLSVKFPDEAAIVAFFEKWRWGGKPVRVRCGGNESIRAVNHSAKEFVSGMAHTNGIESVWAVMKRGHNGAYHNWGMKHMRRHLNEFTFRLSEGNVRVDTIDRLGAMIQGANGRRLTYKGLVA